MIKSAKATRTKNAQWKKSRVVPARKMNAQKILLISHSAINVVARTTENARGCVVSALSLNCVLTNSDRFAKSRTSSRAVSVMRDRNLLNHTNLTSTKKQSQK